MTLPSPSRPPIYPPAPAQLDASGSGSTSTSPRQSGPPSRLEVSSGLSSNETMASSSDEDEIVFVQSPPVKAGAAGGKGTPKAGGKPTGVKRAREETPPSDTADEVRPPKSLASATPIKLTSKDSNTGEAGKDEVKYCHQDHQPRKASDTITCTNTKSNGKACTLAYCSRCLLGRYGEKLAQIVAKGTQSQWKCPACREICKHSLMMNWINFGYVTIKRWGSPEREGTV